MDGGIYQCKPFYRRFQEKVWGYARGNITITMYLGNRLLRWLVIFFYFIINYAGKQNQFVLYYIMRTCFFTHHMHLFAIVNWVACSSLMGYLVHRYIVSISVRQRTHAAVRAVCLFRAPTLFEKNGAISVELMSTVRRKSLPLIVLQK